MGVVVGAPRAQSSTNFSACVPFAVVDQRVYQNSLTCVIGSGSIVILLDGEKITALSYEFTADQAENIAKTLVKTYGKPRHVDTVDLQNAFGATFASMEMQWDTPVGLMEFDERYKRIDKGRIMINPDKINALGTPEKF
jgi:hypothetical protein